MQLFAYGTLMDRALLQQLTGRYFRTQVALLRGYRKVTPQDGYSYIVADSGETVEGILLHDVDADALRAFDLYEEEGQLYRRTAVVVIVNAQPMQAFAYVGIPDAHTQS
jgi:gamma-glutamylcyclotransferase (GGCT)/AIG2-like uncharacterized protein YtfP